jgi:hypothetical protein
MNTFQDAAGANGDERGSAGMVLGSGELTVIQDAGPQASMRELRRRRQDLAQRVAELTWDLGGLTYEMAVRDHYRLDVLARKASELQQADAELNEVQRLLAGAEAGIHGQCRSCGAVHSRGAAFCWHCGTPLQEEARPALMEEAAQSV